MGLVTIDDKSLAKFEAGLAAWEAKVTKHINDVYRGLAISLFNYAAWETPQWTGSAAANWNIQVGAPSSETTMELKRSNVSIRGMMTSDRQRSRNKYGTPVTQKGDPRAVAVAVRRNSGKLAAVHMSIPIYITNAAKDFTGEAYIKMLEANPNSYLRPVNEPGHMVARGVAKASARFARITPGQEIALKTLKLGDPSNAGLR